MAESSARWGVKKTSWSLKAASAWGRKKTEVTTWLSVVVELRPPADLLQRSWHCNHLRGFQKMAPNRETIQRAAAVWRTNGWLLLSEVRMVQTGWRTLKGNGKSNNHWFHPTLQRLQSWSSAYALNSYFVKGAVYLIKWPVDVPVIIQSQNHKKKQKKPNTFD